MNFLKIEYPDLGFLINREQVLGSIFFHTPKPIKSFLYYLSSIAFYKEEKVLLFDLSLYLEDLFAISNNTHSPLLLIVDVTRFSEEHREYFREFYEKHNLHKLLSPNYLALKIKSNIITQELFEKDLKTPPLNLRASVRQKGFLGFHFESLEKANYWLDIENLIFNEFLCLKEKRSADANFNSR